MFKCEQTDCKYETKRKGSLKTHLFYVHNIGKGAIHYCEQINCKYYTKQKSHMKPHLSAIHDIGDETCDYCFSNVFKLYKFFDYNLAKDVEICVKCLKKNTGFNSRIEKDIVEFLKTIPEIGNYIVLEDLILKDDQIF